jgi:hypothetical protein
MIGGDRINAVRRHCEQRVDQGWAIARHRYGPATRVDPYDGDPRLAIVTVNRSTTQYLKLMLLTLSEQEELSLVRRIVIVDNGSRDGGDEFLQALSDRVSRVELVRNRLFTNHARGMRAGTRALERAEGSADARDSTNITLYCDPDVIFRKPETLVALASVITVHNGAFAGELRRTTRTYPDAQASFIAVRRDWSARREISPLVNHGSPSLWMQESIWEAGGVVVDFPSNLGGYILHRGRTAVAATSEHSPWASYATARHTAPHFMNVPDGAAIWAETEARWLDWLQPEREAAAVALLADRFSYR